MPTIGSDQPHGDIEYRAIRIEPGDIEHAIVNVLRFFEAGGAMIFCATREGVRRLHASLVARGFAAVALSGEFSQADSNQALTGRSAERLVREEGSSTGR